MVIGPPNSICFLKRGITDPLEPNTLPKRVVINFVADVVPNRGGADSKPAILDVCPDVIAIGSDWARKDYHSQMGFSQDWLDQQNISLLYIPYTADISTTILKARLVDSNRV
jgi:hypothetical protein